MQNPQSASIAVPPAPRSAGLSRSASAIVTSRRPSLRLAPPAGPPAPGSAPRPITFALPPATPTSGGASPTTPSHERGNPLASSPSSFLNRLSRTFSQSRTKLVRRVSKGTKATTSPTSSKPVSVLVGDKENHAAPPSPIGGAVSDDLPRPSALAPASAGPAPLRRTLRVSPALMRRSRSEGQRQAPRIPNEGEKMKELVARANGYVEVAAAEIQPGLTRLDVQPDAADERSHVGSYFWSDSLGVCWDGREVGKSSPLRPDLLFAYQQYSSNSDVVPQRAVYASTLSSFPPRPPLRPRTPELSPAAKIIAEYRATHSPMAPSVRTRSRDELVDDDDETPQPSGLALTPLAIEPPSPLPAPTPINPFDAPPLHYDSPTSPTSSASFARSAAPPPAEPARSYASSSASSAPSEGGEPRFRFGTGSETGAHGAHAGQAAPRSSADGAAADEQGQGMRAREDSSTSLESLAGAAGGARPAREKAVGGPEVQRFQLVDEGPVAREKKALAEGVSLDEEEGDEEWQECE
ncbi:uncharacterized protein JCM10292_003703 [Rhodotorula paludigena]|uniref:uncharacterized protein n=1 Tax=Rhodotorula paludigena TaxID=86838 RepID=UPI003171E924